MFVSWAGFDSSFLFFSISRFSQLFAFSISARADWDGTCFLFTLIGSSISTCVLLDYFVRLLCFAAILPALFDLLPELCVFCLGLFLSSPVECLTLSLHSLPVVGCLWSVCLRAQPSGLYCLLWKLLLATPAWTTHPLAQVKSATGFQFCFCFFSQFCECLFWLANTDCLSSYIEELYWRINILCFDLPSASGSLCADSLGQISALLECRIWGL